MSQRLRIKHAFLSLPLLLALFCASTSAKDYYRWKGTDGSSHFADLPPKDAVNPQRVELALQQPIYIVEKVIDGDTIIVRHAGKVRLLGINTPEIAYRSRAAETLGDEAHNRLYQLLNNKRVYLEFDQQRRDRFKRLLAHVTLEDGGNINERLLREGLARALFLQPNMNHLHDYYRIEAEAQQAKRGIWALPEFQIRPASQAKQCIKRFCQLRGKILHVEQKRLYTYLQLPGELQVAIQTRDMPPFHSNGLDLKKIKGKTITVRGWVSLRKGKPYLKLLHTLQIQSLPP